jgi:hypothetical protein
MSGAHRKLIAELFVLDGRAFSAKAGPYFDLHGPELGELIAERLAEPQELVMGRRTYQMLGAMAGSPEGNDPLARGRVFAGIASTRLPRSARHSITCSSGSARGRRAPKAEPTEWQDDVVVVRLEDGDPCTVGSRFTTTRRIGGVERTMTQEVSEGEAPRKWAARRIDGPIRPNATITIEPLEHGARSRVTFAPDFENHGIGVPLLPLVRRQTERVEPRSYQKLKERLEGRR